MPRPSKPSAAAPPPFKLSIPASNYSNAAKHANANSDEEFAITTKGKGKRSREGQQSGKKQKVNEGRIVLGKEKDEVRKGKGKGIGGIAQPKGKGNAKGKKRSLVEAGNEEEGRELFLLEDQPEKSDHEGDQNPMLDLEFRKKLLKIQSVKPQNASSGLSSSTLAHLSTFKSLLQKNQSQLTTTLTNQIHKTKSTQAAFITSLHYALQTALLDPQISPLPPQQSLPQSQSQNTNTNANSNSNSNASLSQSFLKSHHNTLKSTSARLMKHSLFLNALIKDIAKELILENTWEKDAQLAMEQVRETIRASEEHVRSILCGGKKTKSEGGWVEIVEKEKKCVARLLKKVPVVMDQHIKRAREGEGKDEEPEEEDEVYAEGEEDEDW